MGNKPPNKANYQSQIHFSVKVCMSKLSKGRRQQKKTINKKIIFDSEIAIKYGVEAAIIIQHFQYSIGHHKKNGTHFHDGRYWTYDSIKNLRRIYPFWTRKIIWKIIKQLEDKKVILSGNHNKNKSDRTKWFSFKDEDKFLKPFESADLEQPVDNCANYVDNSVNNPCINNLPKCKNKTQGNEPYILKISYEIRSFGHFPKWENGMLKNNSRETAIYFEKIPQDPQFWSFSHLGKCISSIYSYGRNSSMDESKQPNNGRSLKKGFGRKNTSRPVFATKITADYAMHKTLRNKLHKLGFSDHEIDLETQNMIKYHAQNPQIVYNEHKCILGWFKNYMTRKRLR